MSNFNEELPPPASLLFGERAYDLLRAFVQVIFPGLGTLYFSIATIVGLPYAEQVVGVIAAICTFLGLLLTVSRRQYNNSDARFDGQVILSSIPDDEEHTDMRIRLDQAAVADPARGELLVKVDRSNL